MNKTLLTFSAVCCFLFSCSEETNNTDSNITDIQDSAISADSLSVSPVASFNVPSPRDLYDIVNLLELDVVNPPLNPIENGSKYVTKKSKALNFGIYSSDMLFSGSRGTNQATVKYFATLKRLSDEIGISGSINDQMVSNVNNNIDNQDSLFLLSDEVYSDIYAKLEEEGKGEELSLIIAGGWVEGMFLVSSLVDTYDAENTIVKRIAEQCYTLEDIFLFTEPYKKLENISSIRNDLLPIKNVYESIETVSQNVSSEQGENGLVLSGGDSLSISKDQFEKIVSLIKELRNKYVNEI